MLPIHLRVILAIVIAFIVGFGAGYGAATAILSPQLPKKPILVGAAVPLTGELARDALGVFGLPSSYWGRHVGSTAIMSFLQKHKPILHVCGHVHEGVSVSACLWREDGNVGIEDF